MDIAQHFVERWNFVRGLKYRHDDRYHWLAFPHVVENPEDESITRHPHFEKFKDGIKYELHKLHPPEGPDPHGGRQ